MIINFLKLKLSNLTNFWKEIFFILSIFFIVLIFPIISLNEDKSSLNFLKNNISLNETNIVFDQETSIEIPENDFNLKSIDYKLDLENNATLDFNFEDFLSNYDFVDQSATQSSVGLLGGFPGDDGNGFDVFGQTSFYFSTFDSLEKANAFSPQKYKYKNDSLSFSSFSIFNNPMPTDIENKEYQEILVEKLNLAVPVMYFGDDKDTNNDLIIRLDKGKSITIENLVDQKNNQTITNLQTKSVTTSLFRNIDSYVETDHGGLFHGVEYQTKPAFELTNFSDLDVSKLFFRIDIIENTPNYAALLFAQSLLETNQRDFRDNDNNFSETIIFDKELNILQQNEKFSPILSLIKNPIFLTTLSGIIVVPSSYFLAKFIWKKKNEK